MNERMRIGNSEKRPRREALRAALLAAGVLLGTDASAAQKPQLKAAITHALRGAPVATKNQPTHQESTRPFSGDDYRRFEALREAAYGNDDQTVQLLEEFNRRRSYD